MSFTLAYRLEFTAEEQELISHYGLGPYALTWTMYEGTKLPDDTIERMQQGRSQTLADVTTLLRNEDIIKTACDELPRLFEVVRTFGGDEVIEYPRTT